MNSHTYERPEAFLSKDETNGITAQLPFRKRLPRHLNTQAFKQNYFEMNVQSNSMTVLRERVPSCNENQSKPSFLLYQQRLRASDLSINNPKKRKSLEEDDGVAMIGAGARVPSNITPSSNPMKKSKRLSKTCFPNSNLLSSHHEHSFPTVSADSYRCTTTTLTEDEHIQNTKIVMDHVSSCRDSKTKPILSPPPPGMANFSWMNQPSTNDSIDHPQSSAMKNMILISNPKPSNVPNSAFDQWMMNFLMYLCSVHEEPFKRN
ncbi:hypothetical protein C9374_003235 [Naegleria lovaniensis]|uniref:Uncharacterized protein n=1 Tax=Naegleria lovaniensis TaxID=51637 RepID=A0AA88KJA4_NAELO|nr:uncharacterized protein C9374_003235 [Naegleria lovaniensis]KAG2385420.1 hypothetical protein C9374_003235 [Naegleria lovaniensis]